MPMSHLQGIGRIGVTPTLPYESSEKIAGIKSLDSSINAHRFDEYLRVNVDQFGRMRPLAPYFSHLALFAEGGTLVAARRPLSTAYGPFLLIKNNPRGLPVWDSIAKV